MAGGHVVGRLGARLMQAYAKHMLSCTRRTCPGCTLETQQFNAYQPRASHAGRERHLDAMLALPDTQRQAFSFLSQGDGYLHGPLAMATVDPAVVKVDMQNAPADRFHGVIDMIDDLLGVSREDLKGRKLAEVLKERYRDAPRSDVYDRLKAGIWNVHRKTGEQLLSMFRQLLVVGHGLLPTKDWEALLAYAAWADLLWLDKYTEADFAELDRRAEAMVRAFKASRFEQAVGEVCAHTVGSSICQAYARLHAAGTGSGGFFAARICLVYLYA